MFQACAKCTWLEGEKEGEGVGWGMLNITPSRSGDGCMQLKYKWEDLTLTIRCVFYSLFKRVCLPSYYMSCHNGERVIVWKSSQSDSRVIPCQITQKIWKSAPDHFWFWWNLVYLLSVISQHQIPNFRSIGWGVWEIRPTKFWDFFKNGGGGPTFEPFYLGT